MSKPIIGADFLKQYSLFIDLKNSCLRDPFTKFSSKGTTINHQDENITLIDSFAKFHGILNAYKDIFCPYPSSPKHKHNAVHRIITNGQPVFSRPRRLNLKQLAIAKQEFQVMMEQGICRPSPRIFDENEIFWTEESIKAFENSKEELAKANLLFHPSPDVQLALYVDASDFALGAALHHITDSN
ncbi:hypothetical protein AVEN_250052-1 [Araneus ventricosus]|uniref:Reverse transcriptase/retrotransposon-derived protein RNase H-like domain-containing protein n=1 Tax=Araneus ventricosus TaxID=182803 RepID=A0A4Y2V1G8_ARAVE|nr:hypothetical protein AVEN_250052-1 [Araneus ventricosus]